MSKGKGNVKNMIPKKQLNKADQQKQAMDKIVLDRKEKSLNRCKMLYKGMMDGVGKAIDEMELDPEIGAPTFQEMQDAFMRAAHSYNQRSMEEQWKNVEIVDPKDN